MLRKTDRKKLYSLHEPEAMCISKGKAHKRYEFGQKVSVVTTKRNNWIVGVSCANEILRLVTLWQKRSPEFSRQRV